MREHVDVVVGSSGGLRVLGLLCLWAAPLGRRDCGGLGGAEPAARAPSPSLKLLTIVFLKLKLIEGEKLKKLRGSADFGAPAVRS